MLCVPDFGTQGTGNSTAGHGAGGAGAVGRRGRPWPRERKGPTSEAKWEG